MKKKHLLLILLMAILAPWAAKAQETLTVHNGTSENQYVPAYVYYFDDFTRSQHVIPADDLDEMAGGTITSIKYYTTSSYIPYTSVSTVDVYLMEVDNTTMTALVPKTNEAIVYQGTLDFVTDGTGGSLTITLANPYVYGGGNLLVGIENTTDADYKGIYFYGETVSYNAAWAGSNSSSLAGVTGSGRKFIPKTTFTYTPTEFPMPKNLAYENVNPTTTNITWQAPETANTITGYKYQYKKASEAEWSSETTVNTTSCSLTSLVGATAYNFKVKTVYGGDESLYAKINFTTIDPCSAPTNFVAESENITENSADISWTPGYDETAWLVKYKKSSEEWTSASEENVNAPNVILSGLESNTTYNVRISPDCDDNKYLSGSFTTKNPCATPTALLITNVLADEVTLSWTPGYMEIEWTVKYKKSSEEWGAAAEEIASGTPTITLTSLEKDTDYNVRIYNCETYLSGDFCTADDCPDGKVCIGTGHTTSSYIPTHNYYKYSLTEQIYTPAEIGETGYIMSIDYYKSGTVAMTRNLNIYIVNTNKDEFASNTDWIPVTVSDLVYSGTVTFADNAWTTIELDTPFSVDGTSNIAIVVDDNTGSDVSSANCYVFATAKNQTIYKYNDDTNYDPTNVPSLPSGTLMTKKNRVRLVVGEPPSCAKPIGLAVNYTGGVTATVSWTSEAAAWNMKVNGVDVAGPITNPYTLTGLELATDYAVTVQADCGETQSDWTTPVNFTTDECMNPVIVNYALTDAYGDGWNGASISVLDEDDHEVENLTVTGSSNSGTLKLCGYHAFVWNSGSYDYECSFTFTDAIAQPLASGTGDSYTNGEVIFTIGILTCPKPTNLAASEILGHSAKLSWTENGEATEWVVAYKADGELNFTEVPANTNPFTLTGLEPETDYTVKVKSDCEVERWSAEIGFTTDVACPTPSNVAVTTTPFSAELSWTDYASSYNLRYRESQSFRYGFETAEPWAVDDFAPCTTYDGDGGTTYAISNESFTNQNYIGACIAFQSGEIAGYDSHSGNAFGIMFDAVTADAPSDDWFILPELTIQDGDVFSFWAREITTSYGPEIINLGVYGNAEGTFASTIAENLEIGTTTWTQYSYDLTAYVGQNIKLAINCVSNDVFGFMFDDIFVGNPNNSNWDVTKTEIATPYTINNLTPETFYEFQIQANCAGTDGTSGWSSIFSFTTPSNCTAPFDLEAEPLDESATLSWTGYQDKFNVRYRTASYYDPIWEDNFENGLNQWTIIAGENAEAVGANAVWYANNPTGGLSFPAYSGDYCATSWSWSTNAYYANNWLITPQLEFQGVAKYYVRTNATYPDKYEVLLSTTTADTLSFDVTLKAMATAPAVADWTEVIIDLKDYEGQQGYIAIHHLDYDMNYLLIDDFGIYTVTPAGAWTTLNNQNSPVDITTVAGTKYEWQVQGINEGCVGGVTAWSDMASFTTYNQVYDDEEWSNGETTIDDDVLLIQDVIIPDGVVAYANSITLEPGAHLIIEDGGQLYTNEPVVATVQKELATPSKTAANWYTISSPANNIAPGAVTNLIQGSTDDYDLYLYNEPTTTWLNQKNDANIAMFANLTNGRGYLYWNSTGADLSFTGTLNVDDVNIALTKTGSDALAGFNLIGNPFSHNIYKGTGGAIESTKLAEGFYVLDNTGTWGSVLAYTTPIKPCQGILVQATESFNLTIANSTSPATGEKRSNDDNIMFVVNNSQFEDAAYALFNDGIGLTKINHRNADAPMLFIPQDGEDYAIATMGDDTETFGLNFKAMTTGMYTLSAKADGNYSYLHVIDRLTGEDIDMLVDGKYEFIGSPRDNEARFIVKLRYNANGFDNDEFIYQNGDELIVNGEGELQVYDVMGRYVASYNVNGNKRISTEQFSNAVYIFRLIGSDVKTQKIVVR